MPSITDTPPAYVQNDLHALNLKLSEVIPAKTDASNLLIATWNLRAFSSVTMTDSWIAGGNDSPKRDLAALITICEIIKRFDVVAIQEVKGDLKALRHTLKYLGEDWSFLMTDVNSGEGGNNERLAFIFDAKRVKLSGLACELVIPPEWIRRIDPNALNRQFVRTPYAVSFRKSNSTFILITLHVDFGDKEEDRVPELSGIAEWMASWAKKSSEWKHNMFVLGDFNIDRKGSPLWQAFTSTGLRTPAELDLVPRTIFADRDEVTLDKFYDQIAWFIEDQKSLLNLTYRKGGSFDFLPFAYTTQNLSKDELSYRISDHYPLWAEFAL